MLIRIPCDYENATEYTEEILAGGLFAVASSYVENMDDTFILLREWINRSDNYDLDADSVALQRSEMIEEILSWDIAIKMNRYQQDVFIPIRIIE